MLHMPREVRHENPHFIDTLISASHLFNIAETLGRMVSEPQFDREEGYNALARPDMGLPVSRDNQFLEFDEEYWPYITELAQSGSPEETQHLKGKINTERRHRTILERSGGAGFAAEMVLGNISPFVLFPTGRAIQGMRKFGLTLGRMAKYTGATAATVAAEEVFYQDESVTRTYLESASRITFATVMSGALAGFLASVGRLPAFRVKGMQTVVSKSDYEGAKWAENQNARSDPTAPASSPDSPVVNPTKPGSSIEAVRQSLFKQMLARDMMSPTPEALVNRTGPIGWFGERYIGSVALAMHWIPGVRRLAHSFMNASLRTPGDVHPRHDTHQTLMMISRARATQLIEENTLDYIMYRDPTGGPPHVTAAERVLGVRQGDASLSINQFHDLVVLALRLPEDQHSANALLGSAPPEVFTAYRRARDNFNEAFDEAVRVGVLQKSDRNIAYLTRIPNRAKLLSEEGRDGFLAQVSSYLAGEEMPGLRGTVKPPEEIMDRAMAEQTARWIYNQYTMFNLDGDSVSMMARPMRERTVDIPDLVLEPWLENNLETIIKSYVRSMAVDSQIMSRETFGPITRAIMPVLTMIDERLASIPKPPIIKAPTAAAPPPAPRPAAPAVAEPGSPEWMREGSPEWNRREARLMEDEGADIGPWADEGTFSKQNIEADIIRRASAHAAPATRVADEYVDEMVGAAMPAPTPDASPASAIPREAIQAPPEAKPVPKAPQGATSEELKGLRKKGLVALGKAKGIKLNMRMRVEEMRSMLLEPDAPTQAASLPSGFKIANVNAKLATLVERHKGFDVLGQMEEIMDAPTADGTMPLGSGSPVGFPKGEMPETIVEHFRAKGPHGGKLIQQYSDSAQGLGTSLVELFEKRWPGFGEEAYIEMMEGLSVPSEVRVASIAKKVPAEVDPGLAFMSYLYERLLPSGREVRRSQVVVESRDMELGDTFTIHGDEFEVVMVEGEKSIANDRTAKFIIGVGAVEEVPVDLGSYKVAAVEADPALVGPGGPEPWAWRKLHPTAMGVDEAKRIAGRLRTSQDPNLAFGVYLHDLLGGDAIGQIELKPGESMRLGDTFTIHGEKFKVVRGAKDGSRAIRSMRGDGAEFTIESGGVANVPVDNGSYQVNGGMAEPGPYVAASPKLPENLSAANPKSGSNSLNFDSDLDKALYILADPGKKSVAEFDYMRWVKRQLPNMSDEAIRLAGQAVRARVKDLVYIAKPHETVFVLNEQEMSDPGYDAGVARAAPPPHEFRPPPPPPPADGASGVAEPGWMGEEARLEADAMFGRRMRRLHEEVVDKLTPPERLGGAEWRLAVVREFSPEKLEEWFHLADAGKRKEAFAVALRNLQDEWGGADIKLVLDEVDTRFLKDIRDAADKGDHKLAANLANERKRTIGYVQDLRDYVRGHYGMSSHPGALFPRVLGVARDWNFGVLGTWIPVASVADFGFSIMQVGFNRAYGAAALRWKLGLGDSMAKLADKDLMRVLKATEMQLQSINIDRYGVEGLSGNATTTRFEKVMHRSTDVVSILTLMTTYQQYNKNIVGHGAIHMIMENAESLVRSGKYLSDIDANRIRFSGLSSDDMRKIGEQWVKWAHEGSHWTPNLQAWTDPEVVKAVENSVWNIQRNAIIAGTPLDLPKIAPGVSDREFRANMAAVQKTMFQFYNFGFTASTRITGAAIQNHDKRYLVGATAALALGMFSVALRNKLRGRDIPDIEDWIGQGIDQSGLVGLTFDITKPLEQLSSGMVGFGPALGKVGVDMGGQNYNAGQAYSTILGSSSGLLGAALGLVGGVAGGEFGDAEKRNLRRLMPLLGAWNLTGAMNLLVKPLLGIDDNEAENN